MNDWNKDMKPNFFLVGFQKCGSSSLFDLLLEHPDVSGSQPKETFALVDEGKANFDRDNNIIHPHFCWGNFFRPSSGKKYKLEASVCNFYQKAAFDYITHLQDKKVLFILRDPIQRFRSTYDYYGTRITTQPVSTLSDYFKLITNHPEKIDIEGAKFALEHGRYCKYIRLWQQAVGEKNVYIISFKELVKNTDECLKGITDFLEISPFSDTITLKHKNKSQNIKNRKLDFFLRKILSGSGLGRSFLGKLYTKVNKTEKKTQIDENLYQKLFAFYKEEYKSLKEYF